MKYRRYDAKVDANQHQIIDDLKKIGCQVEPLMGSAGMPDLICCLRNRLVMFEIKNPDGKNKVNSFQIDFHEKFKGHCHVVRSSQEALEIMTKETVI
tara:strand:+ start:169 stop:459 length:291 start_codon:yes stop_codon:yes gene_type:complete